MADRYLGDGESLVKIGAPHKYKVGDVIFYSVGNHTGAGEVMFLGRLKASPENLAVVDGKQMYEIWEGYCTPAGRSFPAEGASWRRAYLKSKPGALI